ncbi:hypothetical protein IX321_002337 [Bacteroides pyogenes]|nr:hypothetical protein [Bacteroides pyogenes]MBR8718365.1 hypothetical protein [Bacteroides pyogenes]MBR8747860.1 hypothetical protein [Bacteroides pyogenes]MBR8758166.1 hypothetical protein [Bacteroides pyogenes]MBR8781384.1 hypothetical protein [Bacteroides pyogenes]
MALYCIFSKKQIMFIYKINYIMFAYLNSHMS